VKTTRTTRRPQGWRPPTRRAFVAMLGAAAAALALREKSRSRPAEASQPKPIWIGHM